MHAHPAQPACPHLGEVVVTQMEFLQPGPFVNRSAQIQDLDAVLTEHEFSNVAGGPEAWSRQEIDGVGPHV